MEKSARSIANTLIEALPYIQRFAGQTVVVKYGGNAMIDESLKKSFALNIVMLRAVGIFPVVVHGGGPQISEMLKKLEIDCEFIQGMRVTTPQVMDVVQMVLVGQVNTSITSLINKNGGKAVGLCGHGGSLLQAEKMQVESTCSDKDSPELIDLGLVGKVIKVNPQVLQSLEHGGFIPVIAPVGMGPDGESLNINADLVAGALAAGLRASKLVMLTDTPGVLGSDGELITELNPTEVEALKRREVISGGMIPKVNCCLSALEAGVERAHIIDGRVPNALLLELFTDKGAGTMLQG
jgi:acetylglutamate kinase